MLEGGKGYGKGQVMVPQGGQAGQVSRDGRLRCHMRRSEEVLLRRG